MYIACIYVSPKKECFQISVLMRSFFAQQFKRKDILNTCSKVGLVGKHICTCIRSFLIAYHCFYDTSTDGFNKVFLEWNIYLLKYWNIYFLAKHSITLYVFMVFVLLTGGKTGVYELEELLTVLREENAQDICVINIPPEVNLTDHMVIVSAISLRHLRAIMSTVNNIVSTYL